MKTLTCTILLTFTAVVGAETVHRTFWFGGKRIEADFPVKESNYTQAEELGFKYVKAMDESEYQTHQRRELQEAESRNVTSTFTVISPMEIRLKELEAKIKKLESCICLTVSTGTAYQNLYAPYLFQNDGVNPAGNKP